MTRLLLSGWGITAIAVALLAVAVTFSLKVSFDHPTSDAIYHVVEYVKPFDEGTLEFSQLFDRRSKLDHSHALAKGFALWNYSWFGLNYRVELIAGLLGLAAVAGLLLVVFFRQSKGLGPLVGLGGICIAVKSISLNATQVLGWPLATFEYWMMFLAIAALFYAARIVAGAKSNCATATIGISVIVLLGSSMGLLGSGIATVAVLLHGWFRDRQVLRLGFAMLVSLVLTLLLMKWLGTTTHDGPTATPPHQLFSFDAVRFVLYAFGQSVIDAGHLKAGFEGWRTLSLLIGGVWLAVQLLIVVVYVRRGHWRRSIAPLLLLALAYAFVFGSLVSRFPLAGPEASLQPRYVRLYELSAVAVAWLAVLSYAWRKPGNDRFEPVAITVMLSVLIVINLASIPRAFQTVPGIRRYVASEAAELRALAAGEITAATLPRIKFAHTKEAVDFLRDRKLSLFRE